MIKHKFIVIVLCALALVACRTRVVPQVPITAYYPYDAGAQVARTKLTEAAGSVSRSLKQISAIEKATHPKIKLTDPIKGYSSRLNALVSVDWTGPIEPIVLRLANASGFKFRVLGNRPAIPVFVEIFAFNLSIADVLRDLNYQGGLKADIIAYTGRNTIELRYRDP